MGAIDRALGLDPFYFDAYLIKGRILAASSDRDGALRQVEHALELKAGNPEAIELRDRLHAGA